MLTPRCRLTGSDLSQIEGLERRTVAVDGGRLKLEWGSLGRRTGDRIEDLLYWQGNLLVGFLGLYTFGSTTELAGMVDPQHRRRGIGSELLTAAIELTESRGRSDVLVVCPRTAAGGAAFARRAGGVFDHAEFALELIGEPDGGSADPATVLRPATAADAAAIGRLLEVGFGHPPGVVGRLLTDAADHVVVERDGQPIGYLRATLDASVGGVYGFVIEPSWRGQGIGRDVLRRVCRRLSARGAERVGLEVEVNNERALGLYTSLGFRPRSTEDYYRLAVAARS
jgi:ribosomal protein S18 acetylase RimI-like enzyme